MPTLMPTLLSGRNGLLTGLLLTVLWGCGGPTEPKRQYADVTGKVTYKTQPVTKGQVLFQPATGAMAAGQGVTIIPENAELTTVQAAGVLNVSRPFLIKLLEDNAIPHRKVGKHRRVRMEDVMAYKARIDRDLHRAPRRQCALSRCHAGYSRGRPLPASTRKCPADFHNSACAGYKTDSVVDVGKV